MNLPDTVGVSRFKKEVLMADKTFAEKYNLVGKGNPTVDKEKEALAEDIETRVACEIHMNHGDTGDLLTMVSCDIHKICRIVLDSICDLDDGKGATPRDVSLQTGFSLSTTMKILEYVEHRIQSQWCHHESVTRYRVIE